jgi:hypothetical protein
MVPQEKGLAAIVPGVLDAEARAAYASAFDGRCDTSGGLGSLDAALDGAALFDVVAGGVVVGRYALKPMHRAHGTEIFIVAAAGAAAGVDLVASVLPYVEQQCTGSGAARLTVNTRRRGLVKKLTGQGWQIDSYVLRKKIQ